MKRTLIALIALAIAAPVTTIPVPADAQVLTGRGSARAARRARPAPPPLSEAEEDRLYEAESQVIDLDEQIAAIEQAGAAAGGLSSEQQTQVQTLHATRAETQEVVERLQAKRDRRR